ncbi:MAG: L-threonylcarbamoyladenylate synthase [Candidatus Peribacteraceae bacterium]|jgi:L-threonylcarbamoyladenylate synthase|nr:L-threonylcarbamoyladenylate synthase [Candidatus Peribacteraceae bacterium]|tara:strand:- start:1695 stop:2294 length:600 start_codon:yes stop_codon:yes gene_type:complete
MDSHPASEEGIQKALDVLRTGGVVAHATETCYGLACDLQNPEAVDRLFAIKQRSPDQPVSALFAKVEQAQAFLEWNEEAMQLASEHLPGPLTIIMKKAPGCNLRVCPTGSESIGLRISSHPTARALVEQFGSPLSTTSANIHGQPNTFSKEDIEKQFAAAGHKPDLILDDGPVEESDTSTVVDVSEGIVHVLRSGDISL